MADSGQLFGQPYAVPDWLSAGGMPAFSLSPAAPAQPSLIGGALSSGFHEALGNIGGAAEAIGSAVEAPGLTDWGRTLAASQKAAATAAGRPDLEADPWSLKGMAYQVLKGVPTLAGALGTGAVAAAAAPEALGGAAFAGGLGLFSFPQAVGGNVAAAEAANKGPLSPTDAAKSLALGVPEAAAMSVMPGFVGHGFEALAGNAASRAFKGAAIMGTYQGALGAAQTAVTQQAFTPDMPISERAKQIVDSALGGGLQGAVFGGASSALRSAPALDKPPGDVSPKDLDDATAAPLGRRGFGQRGVGATGQDVDLERRAFGTREQPPGERQLLSPPEHMTPLASATGNPYADAANADLTAMVKPLEDKGADRTAAENVQHGLLQEEIARRTMPGLEPGEGALFTPEQMAARAPDIAATKALALKAAGGGEDDSFFASFNAASEPELVNAIAARVEGKEPKAVPGWLQTLAEKYGVPVGDKGSDPAERLVALREQEALSLEARDEAVAAGKVPAMRAANSAILDLAPKIADARRLLDIHDEAAKLLEQPTEDATGQLNLPGVKPGEPVAAEPVPPAGPAQPAAGQRELFTRQETGEAAQARQVAVKQFQDEQLAKMAPRVQRQAEPFLRGLDVTNVPELINALRAHVNDMDANNSGRLTAGAKALTSEYRVTDLTGGSVDLNAEHDMLQARYDDLLDRASKTQGDGQKSALINQAITLRNTTMRSLEERMDQHRQADELGSAAPAREIPDRVPEGMAKPWSRMQTIKETEGVDPKIVKAADTAQKAIETNVPEASRIAQNVTKRLSKFNVREAALTHAETRDVPAMEGQDAVREPGAKGLDVLKPAKDGSAVGEGNAKGDAAAGKEAPQKVGKQVVKDVRAAKTIEPVTPIQAEAETHWQTAERVANELGSNLQEPSGRVLPATAEGFNTAGLKNPPLPERLPPRDAKVRLQSIVKDWNLGKDDPRTATQAFVERALASKDPRDWAAAENALAKIQAVTGRPMNASISFGKRGVGPAPAPVRLPLGEKPPATSWATPVADALHGDVIHVDDNTALVRGFNTFGKSVYVPVDNALNLRGTTDVRTSTVRWLSDAKKAELAARAKQAETRDRLAFEANPDGPFKGAVDKVVGTPSADPRLVSYIAGLVRQVGINARVLVTHPDDVRGSAGDKLGLHGPFESARTAGVGSEHGHVRSFGEGNKDFYIHIDPTLNDTMKVETAAHEVGHIVFETELRNASPETKAAIEAAYQKWYKEQNGVTAQELVRSVRNRATSALLDDNFGPRDQLTARDQHYLTQKTEWFADNVSRWATTAEKPRTLVEKFFSAVAQKLREFMTAVTGNKFMPDASVRNFLDHLAASTSDVQALSNRSGARIPMTEDTGPRTIPEVGQTMQRSISSLEKVQNGVNEAVERASGAVPTWLRKKALIAESLDGIVRIAGQHLTTSRAWADTHTQRQAISDIKNKPDVRSAASYFALKPEVRELVNRHIGMLQNSAGLDSRKPWAAHTDLHDLPNAADLKQRHQEMVSDLSRLRQKGGFQALQDHLQMMQTKRYQSLAAALHGVGESWAERGVQFEGHGQNPDLTYQFMSKEHDDPKATNAFYRGAAQTLRDGIQKYVDAQKAAAAEFMKSDPKKYGKMIGAVDELQGFLRMADAGMTQAAKGTYSPLSHGKGQFFVAAKLASGEDGRPTSVATQALQAALDKAGYQIGVFHDEASSTVMSRVKDRGQLDRLVNTFKELEGAGHLSEVKSGYPENINTMGDLGPKYMKAMAEAVRTATKSLEGEEVDPNIRNEIQAQMMARWMDMLPDHSVAKYLQPRKFVSGFDKNMVTSGIEAARNISRASTFVSMQGQVAKIREAMRQEVLDAKNDNTSDKRFIAHDVANELWMREAQAARSVPATVFDSAQAIMHTLRIGFNPPYMLTMLSQIPTLLHPELSKKYGYAKSAVAIGGAMGRTFNILKAVMQSPDWATVGFREDALRKAGIAEKDIQTIMRLDNAGGLSNNTYTTAMTDLGEGADPNKVRYKNWANAMGLYAEMSPRIAGALAAADLYDKRPIAGMTRDAYVHDVVTNSQFNWGPGQSSRITSKSGPLGAYSRISLAFMQFQTKMVEKLYTEAHDLFSKDSSPQLRKEAGTFLMGHLVATTAIAGTLGLPAASFMAGLVDKLAEAFTGKDGVDTIGLYRTWMANTFGPDVADVLAKGLPRALGLDLSHLGDQNLLPGTSIMVEKRKFEDASKDWFKSMAGSAFGEVGDLYLGLRDMTNGDYLRGAIKVMPEGVKGLAEAYYLTQHGYVDKNGNKLPMQPRALDILTAAVGIDPANLAQYQEADRIKTGLMAQRQYREQNISSHLVRSIMEPGSADTGYWADQAMQYQLDHPGIGGPLESLQNDLTKFATKSGVAEAFGLPLGVKPLDFGIQQAAGFLTPQR